MKLKEKLDRLINQKKTLLGVGPMSKNVVDSTIEIANKFNTPLMFIASRRQIDSSDFGGGYVNNWDTASYSKYVKKRDKKNNLILCRDHGGPWQNNLELKKKLNLVQAMKSAKQSYLEDIKNNFEIIHIDASLNLRNNNKINDALERTYELYEYCYEQAHKFKKKILIEVGTEEQTGSTNTFEEIEFFLENLVKFCNVNNLPKLFFIVLQSGTKVMEMRNVGIFESNIRIKNQIPVEIQIFKLLEICKKFGVYFKEHNTDYLTNESLRWHPFLGIHASNVAPEFGVTETKTLIELMNYYSPNLKNNFIDLCIASNKWKKWVLSANVSKLDKALICGHYVFSTTQGREIINEMKFIMKKKKFNLDHELKKSIKISITRYLKNFRLI
jgi:hypothetical protein